MNLFGVILNLWCDHSSMTVITAVWRLNVFLTERVCGMDSRCFASAYRSFLRHTCSCLISRCTWVVHLNAVLANRCQVRACLVSQQPIR